VKAPSFFAESNGKYSIVEARGEIHYVKDKCSPGYEFGYVDHSLQVPLSPVSIVIVVLEPP
jgi:hypothetical protein